MKNVQMSVKEGILTITVDLSQEHGPSSTGKSIIIASTEGNMNVPGQDEIKIGMNVYRSRPRGKN